MTNVREERIALFSDLQGPDTQPRFWARVADDVDWTVHGTHPLAGSYHNKQEFTDATFGRLPGRSSSATTPSPRMRYDPQLRLRRPHHRGPSKNRDHPSHQALRRPRGLHRPDHGHPQEHRDCHPPARVAWRRWVGAHPGSSAVGDDPTIAGYRHHTAQAVHGPADPRSLQVRE
jgi:hypothetical protein